MTLLLGVDGGRSKAIALVGRADGTVLASSRRLGSADIYDRGGEEAAVRLIDEAVEDALLVVGADRSDIGRAVFSVAGADWPEDFELIESSLIERGFGRAVRLVVNDGIGALFGAVPDGPAVVVALGTGAATGARGHDGRTWHSSFWQYPQGAEELVQRALAAIVRSDLEVRAAPGLVARVLDGTSARSAEDLLHRLTGRGPVDARLRGMVARALIDAAEQGDPIARSLARDHGTGIGEVAAAAARRVGIADDDYALSFCGGLVRAGAGVLVDAAVGAVRAAGQAPRIVAPRWQPAMGALVIGLRSQGVPDWEEVAGRLEASAPPPELFDVMDGAGAI